MIAWSKSNKVVFTLGIAVFLFISLFGALHMGMGSGDSMDNCPFSAGISMCMMAPLEHIGAAQSFLNALFSQKDAAYFLSLIASAAIFLLLFFIKIFSPPRLVLAHSRVRDESFSKPPSFLQEAFSNGILHSKSF